MQIKKEYTRNGLIYLCIVLFFLALSYLYMSPVLSGKVVNQGDIQGYMGMAHEMSEHNAAHPDDPTAWSGSIFSGMPTTVISAPSEGDLTQSLYSFLFLGKRPATYLFVTLLGAFLLMLSMGIGKITAVAGAIAMAFCSYNFQIINAGHNTKMQALALLPWVLAAFIYTYRANRKETDWRKWLVGTGLGATLFGLAVSLQVKANHQQITYYLGLMLIIFAVSEFVVALLSNERKTALSRFAAASALLLVLGLAGVGANANKLLPIYKYTPYSMRGGSELASASGESGAAKGLDMDYATSWSYGWEELANTMVPNLNGGSSSGAVDFEDSQACRVVASYFGDKTAKDFSKGLPLYWGPQPFTAGPMYIGAITLFLFLLGLLVCENKDRWWMLACTVLAILLGVGSHFQAFTTFFYNYAPLYNKFRTVSMALTVLQYTLPLLGFLALDKVMRPDSALEKNRTQKSLAVSYAIAAGFCILLLLFPGIAGSYTSPSDGATVDSIFKAAFGSAANEYALFKSSFIGGLAEDRISLMRADALRSLLLISAAAALLWWGAIRKRGSKGNIAGICCAAICALVLLDLYPVDKRYLSDKDFVSDRDFKGVFRQTKADKAILQDKDPSYRVLNLSTSTFNDSRTSYWHKSIGGYSPAKLQRYQDLIEHHIMPEINSLVRGGQTPVLNALNMRYIIVSPDSDPVYNPEAYGNAWFVDEVVRAFSPDEAIDLVGTTDLLAAAVLEDEVEIPAGKPSEDDDIVLSSYAPNELHYVYRLGEPRMAVFSEVYYPEGWHAYLADTGEEVSVFRADWILRAASLPAGEHELVMRFDPESYSDSAKISLASSLILIILFLACLAGVFIVPARRKEESNETE